MHHTTLTGQMAERKRDALEAVWLGQLCGIAGATATPLDTPDDLYNYLLIDTRSGWQSTTSVVAQVIASLQQYINNILFGSEPGYSKISWQQDHRTAVEQWQSTNAQYDTWAASVLLSQYPENYLTPSLRIGQTGNFAKMVSDLNQGPLNDDTILAAVQGYLDRFEEVANLSVISGYVAGTDLTQDDYYFLGRSVSKPHTCYWRKCAMRLNTVTTMVPDSWSEWQKINLPLGGDNVIGQPRPLVHNNRLYVIWFERKATDSKDTKTPQTVTPSTTLTAQMAYLKFDGTWSTPQILGSTSGATTDSGDGLYSSAAQYSTLALQFTDAAQNPFLYAGLYSAADAQCPTQGIANDKAMVCALDAWMNPVPAKNDAINVLFDLYAQQALARQYNASVANEQTTSQQFLQRALAINSPSVNLADTHLAADQLSLGGTMPTMALAAGKAERPNTVVTDTTDIKNSQIYLNFTPGTISLPYSFVIYGSGPMVDSSRKPVINVTYQLLYNNDVKSPEMMLTLHFSASDYIKARTANLAEIGFKLDSGVSIERSTELQFDDAASMITAPFPRTAQEIPAAIENFSLWVGKDFFAGGDITLGLTKNIVAANDCLTELSILNSDKQISTTVIKGLEISATDYCSAVLQNLNLSQQGDFAFYFQTRVQLWNADKTQTFGLTTRNATTNGHFTPTLSPATDPMPVLDTYTDPTLGTAEFIHFDFKAGADKKADFAPENIRLNTLFAKELVKSAQNGLDSLFRWNTQLTSEPDMGPGAWLALTLPAYDPAVHGDNPACSVVMYPADGLQYPLASTVLAGQEKVLEVFVPGEASLLFDQSNNGIDYQVTRVRLQIADAAFVDNGDSVVIGFMQQHTSIAPQVLNKGPWGPFKPYAGFTNALVKPGATGAVIFSDANGLYFWELFYHTPSVVAYALQARGQHAEARHWQQRIFDPAAVNQGTDAKGNSIGNYWKVVPIAPTYAKEDPSYAIQGPTDPQALAYANPEHFRKANYMAYVQTQIALGDFYYRQLTADSLNQALQIYTQTNMLLGARPDDGLVNPWVPTSLQEAASHLSHEGSLARFEQQLTQLPENWASYPTDTQFSTVRTSPSAAFYLPINNQLLLLWDTLDVRRHNLRHNLDINGNPLNLPLFAAPSNRLEGLAREAQGGTSASQAGAGVLSIPPYRYGAMSEKAREASSMLSDFGQQLLRAMEARDGRHIETLGQTQLGDLWVFVQQAQQQAVDIASNSLSTLTTSLAAAQQRHDYYQGLVDSGRSALESDTLSTLATSSLLMGSVAIPSIAAGIVALTPNIFGLADGGSNWAGPLKGIAEGTMALGLAANTAAEAIGMQAGFERRQADWQQQAQQAKRDVATLNSQIIGQQLQIAAAQTAQALASAQHAQVMATYAFLSTRFTNEALYQWLTSQLSALYYQAYDATLSLCLSAQTCWQYELGDFVTTFIPTGGWNSQYQGLLAGETLRLSLQQMDSVWLTRNTRSLNITRSLSLRAKLGETAWAEFLATLKTGKAPFSLTEQDFDLDYPGHYLRQIASVSVSLPALVGPYQNVRATLTQTGNSLVLKADLEAIKYLKDGKSGSAANLKRNVNASQEIALSAGLDDSGLFVLNTNDSRYLPFEGTGAVSDWVLAFPNPKSTAQQQVLTSLSDIVLTVRYTANNGGDAFAQQVLDFWTSGT